MKTPDLNHKYTFRDWLEWEGRWELIDGSPYNMTPAPSWHHQYIVSELYFALRTYFGNLSGCTSDSHAAAWKYNVNC
jgi:Uma2 family endonuclease